MRIGRKVSLNPALYLVEETVEENIEVDPADYAITSEAMDVATNAEIELAHAENDNKTTNKTAKTQLKEKSPMIIAIDRDAEKMTICAGTGKAKAKKYFVDGEKMTKGQAEIVIRSYVQSAIETKATIEIYTRLATEFDAIAKTPYKGEFPLVYVDENGKPIKADDEKKDMFADSVDTTPHHAKIIMFGDKVPMFQVICDGRDLKSKRGGNYLSQKEVDEWIIKAYQMRKQYPNLTIEVPGVVAALYLDSIACNPRFIRELNVTLTSFGEESAEVNPSEYAITPEAMDVAINAEIEAANNEAKREQIFFLKSDIRYREGAIKDLDENHLAKYPDDESLKALRAEWINELADLKAQLDNLENGEAKAVADAKEVVKERDTEFENVMAEISFFTHCMDVNSLKKQIGDVENEIDSLVRMLNRASKTYGTPAHDLDDSEEFCNAIGADLFEKLNKRANFKAALAKLAPCEVGDESDEDEDNTKETARKFAVRIWENPDAMLAKSNHIYSILVEKAISHFNKALCKYVVVADISDEHANREDKIINQFDSFDTAKDCALRLAFMYESRINRKAQIEVIDDYAINKEAMQIAIESEINAAEYNALKSLEDNDDVFNIILDVEELNDANDNLGNNTPKIEDDFQSKLAELKAAYDAATVKADKADEKLFKAREVAKELEKEAIAAENVRFKAKCACLDYLREVAEDLTIKLITPDIFNIEPILITKQNGCQVKQSLFGLRVENTGKFFELRKGYCPKYAEYETPAQIETVIGMLKAAVARGDKDFIFPTVDELSGVNEKAARRKTG